MSFKQSPYRSPKHVWSDQDRLLLTILDLCFTNQASVYAVILSSIRRRALLKEGFQAGLPTRNVVAQLYEYKAGKSGSRIYTVFSMLSIKQLRNIFGAQLKVIEDTARRLKIKLTPIKSDDEKQPPPVSNFQRRIRAVNTVTESTVTTWYPNSDEEDVEEYYTPTKRGRGVNYHKNASTQPKSDQYLSPMISPGTADLNAFRRPFFLYRAFEVTHNLRARRFLDTDKIPSPPPFKSQAFAKEVRPHLNRNESYASPFLSFAQSPAVAIKHAFTRTAIGTSIALAVIRYDDLRRDAIERFGLDCGPYLVPVICKEHELWDLPGAYTGIGEFLIWGSVDCEPVAIVKGIDTVMIRAVLRTTRQISLELGTRLNKYLPRIRNDQQMELFIYQLLSSYKIVGHKTARGSVTYTDFVRAATQAQLQDQEELEDDTCDIDSEIIETPKDRQSYAPSAWRSDLDEDWFGD